MSGAPAPARKGPLAEETEFRRLAREMGSNGLDPIPPDQYLYFLGKKEPPLQRLLALVRSLTIRRGRRSAYCVDEHGREVKLLHLEKLLEMDHGNFMRAWKEAVARGLVRRGDQNYPHRIYLCGTLKESVGYKEEEGQGGVCTDSLRFLSPTQRKVYDGWRKEQQVRFYAEFDQSVKYKQQLEKEAISLARYIGDRALDQVFATHALPKTRLATAPPQPKLLQLSLVSAAHESVQTSSVPTLKAESVRTTKTKSVPNGASLLPLESREAAVESVGQSAIGEDRPTDENALGSEIKAALKSAWGAQFPLDAPTPRLIRNVMSGLRGAPVALLTERMKQRRASATGYGFAVVLANDVGIAWMEASALRAKDEAARLADQNRAIDQMRADARQVLADPESHPREIEWAKEVLAEKAAAAGGAA